MKKVILFAALAVLPVMVAAAIVAYSFELGAISARANLESARWSGSAALDRVGGAEVCGRGSAAMTKCTDPSVRDPLTKTREIDVANAQVDTARWTFWAMVVAALQLPISLVGIIGLFGTIRVGWRANEISHDMNRAWIRIDDVKIRSLNYGRNGDLVTKMAFLEIEISNLGNSPAVEVAARACLFKLHISKLMELGNYLKIAKASMATWSRGINGATTVVFPSEAGRKISLQTNVADDHTLPFWTPTHVAEKSFDQQYGCVAVFYRTQSGRQGCTLIPFLLRHGKGALSIDDILSGPPQGWGLTDVEIVRPTAFDIAE